MEKISTAGNEIILKDILEERRHHSDVVWVSKPFSPKQAYVKTNNAPNPLLFRYKMLTDKSIHSLIREVYPNESSSYEFHRIDEIVKEMGYLKNISVVRWLGLLLIKILKKTVQSIFVTESKLLKLKCAMGKNPVIFLPTHRSYADFILMAFLCFNYDIEIPVVVAGMDFYAMFGMAMLLRRCGAMYMRRSFKDDKVYGTIFKKYVQTVIANGNSPFEFFIEGTRSRCGKSLIPKLGLLKMVVEVYLKKEVEDITFVPISINYERLIEDLLFAREMLGIPKPKESTTGMLKGISMLEEEYGHIYVNIGKEISLQQFVEQNDQNDNLLSHLAHLIISSQQKDTIITFFNILSAVILQCLLTETGKTLKISSLSEEFRKLKDLLMFLGAVTVFQGNIEEEIERNLKIHTFLTKNVEEKSIEIKNYDIENASLPQDINKTAVSFILLQHYSNCCYFFLINPAAIIAILKTNRRSTRDSLFTKFGLFRDLFKYEFAFFQPFEEQDFQKAYAQLFDLKLIKRIENNEIIFLQDNQYFADLWCSLLIPYLKGYLFICENLVPVVNRTFEEIRLKERIKKQLKLELDISNEVGLFYALSSYFMTCAFSSLIDMRILFSNNKKIMNYIDETIFPRTTKCVTVTNLQKLNIIIEFLKLLLYGNDITQMDKHNRASIIAKL